MDNLAEQLDAVMLSVWETMIGTKIMSTEVLSPWKGETETGMMACIQITGNWEGAVTIECTAAHARAMAETMFCMEPGEAEDEEVIDAFGELVNVVGGNVKAILDGGADLSLPAVTTGLDYRIVVPGSTEACQLAFDSEGEHIRVGLLARQS
ncbi:MAG: chemotaxis protein CheX [Planctomycetota bacterium]|jgi:chemotaxis protein CheX